MVKKIKQISVNKYDVLLILATIFFISVYAPLEMILTNIEEFWFDVSSAFSICGFVFALLFIFFVFYFKLVKDERLLGAARVVLLSILLSTFLQGDFLNINFGVLNGADVEWKKYLGRMILDLVVWLAIFLTTIFLYVKRKELYNKVQLFSSIFILGISLITIAVLFFQHGSCNKTKEGKNVLTNEGMYETSTEDNIVVFVLDMYDSDYFSQLLKNKPELYKELDGFVFFENYSGTYSTTKYSMSHLYTGAMFNNFASFPEMMQKVSSNKLYIDELSDNGYDLYFFSDVNSFIPDRLLANSQNVYHGEFKITDYRKFALTLYRLAGVKYLPNCFKPIIIMDGTEFDELKDCDGAEPYFSKNTFLKDNMPSKFNVSDKKSIRYIYMEGTHYPYSINKNGNKQMYGKVSSLECAEGVLLIVQSYIEKLIDAGTYDNTAIVITADHGYYVDGTLQSPVMIVKPFGSKGELRVSHAPTCQKDWAATILDLANIKQETYGKSVFDIGEKENRERFFYQYNLSDKESDGNYRLIEYSIDSSGTDWDCFKLTNVDITETGERIEHEKYCDTCQNNTKPSYEGEYPRLIHEKSKDYPD